MSTEQETSSSSATTSEHLSHTPYDTTVPSTDPTTFVSSSSADHPPSTETSHASSSSGTENTKVFYRNLSTEASEEAIKALFLPYGTVEDFILLKHPATHKSKGAGFVRFTSAHEASAAITGLNGTVPAIGVSNIGSATMEVRYPESNKEKSQRIRNPPNNALPPNSNGNYNPHGGRNGPSRYPGGNRNGPGTNTYSTTPTNNFSSVPYGNPNPYNPNPYAPSSSSTNPLASASIPYGYTLPPSTTTTASPYGQVPVGYTMNPYGFYLPNPSNPYSLTPSSIPPNPYGAPHIPGTLPPPGAGNMNETTIFVHGLPEGYTEVELSALFANSGTVTSSKIVNDKVTGKPRDYGFVSFATHDGALQAVKLMNNMMMPHGRKLRVEVKSGSMEKGTARHGGMPRGGGGYEGGGGNYNRGGGGGGYGRR